MTYPKETAPVLRAVSPTAALVEAWDVRDTTILSLHMTVTGAEPVTLDIRTRIDSSMDWGMSPLQVNTPDGSGTLQVGETGRVDIDAGAQLEVALFASCSTVSSELLVAGRTDKGRRR